MNKTWQFLGAFVFALPLCGGNCVSPVKTGPGDTVQARQDRGYVADAVVGNWQEPSRLAARRLIEVYGVPDEVRPESLAWNVNGSWRRTVVRDATPPYVGGGEIGVVEQSVEYDPPTNDRLDDLAAFDHNVAYDSTTRLLTSRSDREEVNILRLNLAHDVLTGMMGPHEAAAFYRATLALEESGKTTPYLLRLRFGREMNVRSQDRSPR